MIKSNTGIFRILFSSIFSLFILVSCGSVPKQEITQPVQEENAAENEPPAQIEQENTVESEPKTETETSVTDSSACGCTASGNFPFFHSVFQQNKGNNGTECSGY